jgi:hypothetical protein
MAGSNSSIGVLLLYRLSIWLFNTRANFIKYAVIWCFSHCSKFRSEPMEEFQLEPLEESLVSTKGQGIIEWSVQ